MNKKEANKILEQRIKDYERGPQGGMASVPYRDPADQWTIGWGHLIRDSERFDRPLTAMQADELLLSDLERFSAGVNAKGSGNRSGLLLLFSVFHIAHGIIEFAKLPAFNRYRGVLGASK